jgi:hypothetical protein
MKALRRFYLTSDLLIPGDNMSDYKIHEVDFGKLRYAPGAPKNAPCWAWRCGCDKCRRELTGAQGLHGPFKTRKAAERDAELFFALYYSDSAGAA